MAEAARETVSPETSLMIIMTIMKMMINTMTMMMMVMMRRKKGEEDYTHTHTCTTLIPLFRNSRHTNMLSKSLSTWRTRYLLPGRFSRHSRV